MVNGGYTAGDARNHPGASIRQPEAETMVRPIPSKNTRCQFGVATRDATPPLEAYGRWWGAALRDQASGIHRPLLTSAAVIAPIGGIGDPLVLVTIDQCVFEIRDEYALRATICARAGLPEAHLLLSPSHSHASANINTHLPDLPGGELAQPFLDHLARQIGDAIQQARHDLAPAWITWGTGKCTLATNRDLWDAEAGFYVCGYNPDVPADDTLLVGRVTGNDGDLRAVLFNYACHPTTLAWENDRFSPDYIGAAREVVSGIYGVPALFLQGALGDLGPRHGFVGDTEVADRNGRQLGFAVASAVEALQPPATAFVYQGPRRSGADLGIWADEPLDSSALEGAMLLSSRTVDVPLELKPLQTRAELQATLDTCTDRVEQERLRRKIGIREVMGDGSTYDLRLWFWRLGDAVVVAVPEEPYSILQTTLREQFPDHPVVVLGVTNGGLGYLPPRERYGDNLYQVWQSPYTEGCLEAVIAASAREIEMLLEA